MAGSTLQMVQELKAAKFPSQVTKGYYDVIRELISALALLEGSKTQGEGAHQDLIDYLRANYKEKFGEHLLYLLEELRIIRNKIEYDGFFVKAEYLERNQKYLEKIIQRLNEIIAKKLP